jgi:hypothetical protein
MAEPETWEYSNPLPNRPKPILYNYLRYTFDQLWQEEQTAAVHGKKIKANEQLGCACFDTGLLDRTYATPIYAYFVKNDEGRTQKWKLFRFCTEADHQINRLRPLPDMAIYFTDPSELFLDFQLLEDTAMNWDHILQDNLYRFPTKFQSENVHGQQAKLNQALHLAKLRIRRNYKIAVPQFFHGQTQLLIPLCLDDPANVDLALPLQKKSTHYDARTVLDLDMAYNNARQLCRPDSEWLAPEKILASLDDEE